MDWHNSFKIFHKNCQYLSNKMLKLNILLKNNDKDVFRVSEHELKSNEIVKVRLHGYKLCEQL